VSGFADYERHDALGLADLVRRKAESLRTFALLALARAARLLSFLNPYCPEADPMRCPRERHGSPCAAHVDVTTSDQFAVIEWGMH
jgi:hypothetical protein